MVEINDLPKMDNSWTSENAVKSELSFRKLEKYSQSPRIPVNPNLALAMCFCLGNESFGGTHWDSWGLKIFVVWMLIIQLTDLHSCRYFV